MLDQLSAELDFKDITTTTIRATHPKAVVAAYKNHDIVIIPDTLVERGPKSHCVTISEQIKQRNPDAVIVVNANDGSFQPEQVPSTDYLTYQFRDEIFVNHGIQYTVLDAPEDLTRIQTVVIHARQTRLKELS